MKSYFPLFLIQAVFIGLGLYLVGCEPSQEGFCDYCRVQRPWIRRAACEKCQAVHVYCDIDSALVHSHEIYENGLVKKWVTLTACPNVPPSPPVPALLPIRPEDRPKGLPWYEEGRSWLSTAVCFLAFFMGYKFGRK